MPPPQQQAVSSTPLPPVGSGRQFAVSQRVVETATGQRPDTPRPEERQQRVSKEAKERTAYPLKLIVERQMGHPMTISEPLFNAWLTKSLQERRFARSAEEAREELKEIREEAKGLSAEVTKLIREGDDSGEGEIAKLKAQGPEESKKALDEFFVALATELKEKNSPEKTSSTGPEPTAIYDPFSDSPKTEAPSTAQAAAAGASGVLTTVSGTLPTSGLVSDVIAEVGDIKDLVLGLVGAAKAVVDSIPMLGKIVAGVKLLAKGVSLVMLAKQAYDVCMAKKSSFSLLEKNVTGAVTSYQKEKGIQIGKEMATTAATGAAAAFGVGGVVSIATKLVDLVAKVAAAIYRAYQIRKLNAKMKGSTPLTLKDLQEAPILGLHLPYLDGVDALALLGVAPVKWQTSQDKEGILRGLDAAVSEGVLRSTDKGWLTARLQWNDLQTRYRSMLTGSGGRLGGAAAAAAAGATAEHNPWTSEFERVIMKLKWTDTYLYAQKWRLYDKDGNIVHEPAPTGLLDRAKEAAKQKGEAAVDALASNLPSLSPKRGSAVGGGTS